MDENSRSSSDSVEVAGGMDSSPQNYMNGHMDTDFMDDDNGVPILEIVEQPQQRGFRFRYECEGPSHGGLQGSTSERYRKTVPTVKIRNYSGPARVIVELVTDESAPKPHAHKLVGKNCRDGKCIVDVKPGTAQISFPNLCIQHVTKKKSAEVLEKRICESMILNRQLEANNLSQKIDLSQAEKQQAEQEAKASAKNMALNVVRLCFQAILITPDRHLVIPSQISDPIFDSKAPGANALKICRMDKYSGCCTGNDEVFLLCEKVQKDDIMVRFLEQDKVGKILWEAYGHFGPFDVHRQFAIVFKTPEYKDTNINSPVNVLVMLQRKSDGESSDPKSFTYYPRVIDNEGIGRKRQKTFPQYTSGGRGGGNGGGGSDLKYGGGDTNGNSSNGMNGNGMQNGGSIPDFKNLKADPFGRNNIINPNQPGQGRQFIQAKRSINSPNYNPMFGTDFLQNTEYVYEEVAKLSPPSHPLDASGTSPFFGSPISPTPYTPRIMSNNPQNVPMSMASPMSNGALSPQHIQQSSVLSPQQMQVASPQSNLGSPINMVASSPGNMPYGGQMLPPSSVQTVSEIQGQSITQPVQVSNVCPESLEADFMANQFNQYQGGMGQFGEQGMYGPQSSYQQFSQQSCAFQARGSGSDRDLQDVLDIIQNQGFDEVDCCRIDTPTASHFASAIPISSEKLISRGGLKPDDIGELTARFNEQASLNFTAKVQKDYQKPPHSTLVQTESFVAMENKAAKEQKDYYKPPQSTSVQTESFVAMENKAVQTRENEAQTDMDPMLKLAMKTSQALQYYASSGDIRSLLMVQRFLMAVQDTDGDLPLHTALINLKYEVFQNILDVMVTLPDAYTRINAYNFHHQTPLHLAVITDQAAAVDLLIRAGADTNLVDRNGYTPAHLAVLYNRVDCLKNLLKYKKKGTTASEPFPELNVRCYDGFTPAHLAAQLENLAVMKLLVHGKADINMADGKSGRTPLHHSVETDDLSLAAYLILQAGGEVNIKRFDGNTALHIACGRGNVGMVALLMAGGADPSIENDDVVEIGIPMEADDINEPQEKNEAKESKSESKEKVSATSDEKDKDTAEEAEKEDKSNSDEEEVVEKPKRGMIPADFADNNEKILRVLNGEPYTTVQDPETSESVCSLRVESGFGSLSHKSDVGDMEKVDIPTRQSLSHCLDSSDWSKLADKLNLATLMSGCAEGKSPTTVLLDYYEGGGGTVAGLVQALKDIKREDCVKLLEGDKAAHKDPRMDSGVMDSMQKFDSSSTVRIQQAT